MGSPLSIFGGPCMQASLYDATNGLLHLSLLGEDVMYTEEPQNIGLSTGNVFELHKRASFEIPILETNGIISDLAARRGIRQEVWLIGMENAVFIDNCLISYGLNRSLKPTEGGHVLNLKGSSADPNHFKSMINILGTYGNCNVDTDTDNIADGWTNFGCTELAVTTSHKAGRGNEQQFKMGASDEFYINIRCPVDQKQIKITISAYVKERGSATAYYNFGLKTINHLNNILDTEEDAGKTLTSGQERRDSKEIVFTPSANIKTLRLYYSYSTTDSKLGIDDVQMEFGGLSNYSES